jgi:multidrug resistance efflux pump
MDILELIEKRKALQGADIGKSSARVKEEKAAKNSDQRDKRDRDKERRRVQNQVQRLEQQLADLEKEEKTLQAEVMKGGMPADALQKGYDRLGELAQRIAAVMSEWEAASAQMEELGEESKA